MGNIGLPDGPGLLSRPVLRPPGAARLQQRRQLAGLLRPAGAALSVSRPLRRAVPRGGGTVQPAGDRAGNYGTGLQRARAVVTEHRGYRLTNQDVDPGTRHTTVGSTTAPRNAFEQMVSTAEQLAARSCGVAVAGCF